MSGPRARRPAFPILLQDRAPLRERIAQANLMMSGKFNNVDDFTLPADTTSLIVVDARVSIYSYIDLVPLDAPAATLVAYVVPGTKQFQVLATVSTAIWGHMSKPTPQDYASGPGAPTRIDNYDGALGQSLASHAIDLDPVTGEVTLNFGGDYRVQMRATFLATNNQEYVWWIARNNSFLPADAVSRTIQITGGSDTIIIDVSFVFPANAGDVIAGYIENQAGDTDTVFAAYLEVEHIGTTEPIPSDEDANFRYVVIG